MKLDKLVWERYKERPSECAIDSHALMMRGGYIKYVASGIYSSYPILRRITNKIEGIIREEMDSIGGQEVLFPVAMPASLLIESGRYLSMGDELLRFEDRNASPMVLGMTHEEAAVQLAREHGRTYAKYPFMIYQIQTKFRDELRPRGGLIRVREFIMKDAYSFHTSHEDLEDYYKCCHAAYERIYARVGIPEVVSVAADSGIMGGSVSHEFMLLTPVGEDTIVFCQNCGFKANTEAAGLADGLCPSCGKPAPDISRGIEVGNIFQLGIKYSASMNLQYTDRDGILRYPEMGCYGIGVGRLAASVCEARHDEYGPVWPASIAPWHAHVCCLRPDDAKVKSVSDKLYKILCDEKIETVYDDRLVSAGNMFSDADLIGAPVRIIVSPKHAADGRCEITTRDSARDKTIGRIADIDVAAACVHDIIGGLMKKLVK